MQNAQGTPQRITGTQLASDRTEAGHLAPEPTGVGQRGVARAVASRVSGLGRATRWGRVALAALAVSGTVALSACTAAAPSPSNSGATSGGSANSSSSSSVSTQNTPSSTGPTATEAPSSSPGTGGTATPTPTSKPGFGAFPAHPFAGAQTKPRAILKVSGSETQAQTEIRLKPKETLVLDSVCASPGGWNANIYVGKEQVSTLNAPNCTPEHGGPAKDSYTLDVTSTYNKTTSATFRVVLQLRGDEGTVALGVGSEKPRS